MARHRPATPLSPSTRQECTVLSVTSLSAVRQISVWSMPQNFHPSAHRCRFNGVSASSSPLRPYRSKWSSSWTQHVSLRLTVETLPFGEQACHPLWPFVCCSAPASVFMCSHSFKRAMVFWCATEPGDPVVPMCGFRSSIANCCRLGVMSTWFCSWMQQVSLSCFVETLSFSECRRFWHQACAVR